VRELENTIENAALYARDSIIAPDDLPEKIRERPVRHEDSIESMFEDLPSLDEMERRYLIYVLHRVGGSRTRAAEVLQIDRRTLYRMAERFRINLKETGE
jgi:DNA-binding NtrC family response regulator